MKILFFIVMTFIFITACSTTSKERNPAQQPTIDILDTCPRTLEAEIDIKTRFQLPFIVTIQFVRPLTGCRADDTSEAYVSHKAFWGETDDSFDDISLRLLDGREYNVEQKIYIKKNKHTGRIDAFDYNYGTPPQVIGELVIQDNRYILKIDAKKRIMLFNWQDQVLYFGDGLDIKKIVSAQ